MLRATDIERLAKCNGYHADADRQVLVHEKLPIEVPYEMVRIFDGFKIGFKPLEVK